MAKVIEIDPLVPTLYHFVYVDILGVIALEQEKVTEIMTELEKLFSGGGPILHEVSVLMGRQEVLGNSIDCSRQATLLTSKRFTACTNQFQPCYAVSERQALCWRLSLDTALVALRLTGGCFPFVSCFIHRDKNIIHIRMSCL